MKNISYCIYKPIKFKGGYTFCPETIKLQVSDKDIMEMEKDSETTYKYDEHGNMIYSLGDRGYLYVVYCKYEYDESGRKLKMQEYHNY